jgi:hypothetical protein
MTAQRPWPCICREIRSQWRLAGRVKGSGGSKSRSAEIAVSPVYHSCIAEAQKRCPTGDFPHAAARGGPEIPCPAWSLGLTEFN